MLEVRSRLEENPWAQVGAPAIAWELSKLGAVVPPERTIEEILERAGATKRQRSGRRASKGIPYPAPAARRAGEVVQVDLVGPRHLDGGVRFHALNQIDVASHHAGIEIIEERSDRTVLAALHALWARHRGARAPAVRQRRPVRVAERDRRGRARVPAPGRHARVHAAAGLGRRALRLLLVCRPRGCDASTAARGARRQERNCPAHRSEPATQLGLRGCGSLAGRAGSGRFATFGVSSGQR